MISLARFAGVEAGERFAAHRDQAQDGLIPKERHIVTITHSKPCRAVFLAALLLQVGCGKPTDPYNALLKQMVGKWDRANYGTYLTIKPDGEVEERVDGNAKPDLWYWGQLKMKSPDVMTIMHNDQRRTEYRMAGRDFIAVQEWNPEGIQGNAGYVLERIE